MSQYKNGLPDHCLKPGELVTFVYPYFSIKPKEVDEQTFTSCELPLPDQGIVDNEPVLWRAPANGQNEKWIYFISTDGQYCSYGLKIRIYISQRCGDNHLFKDMKPKGRFQVLSA